MGAALGSPSFPVPTSVTAATLIQIQSVLHTLLQKWTLHLKSAFKFSVAYSAANIQIHPVFNILCNKRVMCKLSP